MSPSNSGFRPQPWMFIVLLIGAFGIWFIPKYNALVKMENRMEAMLSSDQGFYSSFLTALKTNGVIAREATDAQIEIVTQAIAARYGEGGSGAVMQWLQEQNPGLDTTQFTALQRQVETGYATFVSRQDTRLDMARTFKDRIDVWPGSMAAWLAGFDEETVTPFEVVLMSAEASADFESGTMTAPAVFGEEG